jgi:hypothetical protein
MNNTYSTIIAPGVNMNNDYLNINQMMKLLLKQQKRSLSYGFKVSINQKALIPVFRKK